MTAGGATDLAVPRRYEAKLGQHAAGGRIVDEMRGGKAGQPTLLEAKPHDGTRRLGRIAVAPPRTAQPKSEFSGTGWPPVEARAADQLAFTFDRETHFTSHWREPAVSLLFGEGERNVAGHGGYR